MQDIRLSPRDFGYMQNLWDGKLLSYHLEKKFHEEMLLNKNISQQSKVLLCVLALSAKIGYELYRDSGINIS